MPHSAKAAEE
jgi:hypothetical protein